MPGRTAILVVNGFDRLALWQAHFDEADAQRYPWIELCLREVARRSVGSDYEVLVWDNSHLPQQRAIAQRYHARLYPTDDELSSDVGSGIVLSHAASLQRLWPLVSDEFDYVMTLDTDAFPIQDGWIETLKSRLKNASLTGIWRDEMPTVQPYVHPSCLFAGRGRLLRIEDPFSRRGVQDVGQRITLSITGDGENVAGLHRSNARSAHFLIGGLYGDLVYHHAAGSRAPVFWMTEGKEQDERVYTRLREAVFEDLDRVVAVLRGESDDDLGLEWA
ncbi:MAG TPA: hypothetical protein VIP57_01625 [Candidatus Dormibacteraeota bacterium]|jgi:hypothetical protein